VPDWYVDLKQTAVPLLGTADRMVAVARRTGLLGVSVDERPVDVGVTEPEQLVDYRLGQAHFAPWLTALEPEQAVEIRHRLVEVARPIMRPYRPTVVFLAARVP
jgi:hypothetical protein